MPQTNTTNVETTNQKQTNQILKVTTNGNLSKTKPSSQLPKKPLHRWHSNRKMPNLQRNKKATPTKIRFQPMRGLRERLYRHSGMSTNGYVIYGGYALALPSNWTESFVKIKLLS